MNVYQYMWTCGRNKYRVVQVKSEEIILIIQITYNFGLSAVVKVWHLEVEIHVGISIVHTKDTANTNRKTSRETW